MKSISEALNHPVDAFQKRNKAVSWGLVAMTICINSVLEPILQYFYGAGRPELDFLKMLKSTGLGLLAYFVICLVFWSVCNCFGSKATIIGHIAAWGISYIPTAICALVVTVTEVFFFVFWNNTIWGMLLNMIFIGILIWKTILFFIYIREFNQLRGWRFLGACTVMGIAILVIAALSGYAGLKTPMI